MTITEILELNGGIRLDIGCGANKQPGGWVGIDVRDLPGVDIVHNVEDTPWPLPDNCVIQAISSHLVEHINPHAFGFVRFMDECWRVMKPGCQFYITCPHGRSDGFIQDPTHCNQVNEVTWRYFDPEAGGLWTIYQPKPWKIAHMEWSPEANMDVILVKRELNGNNGN